MGASRPWATSRIGFNPRRQVVPQPWALVSVVSIVSVWKATPPAAGPWPLDPDERPAAGRMSVAVFPFKSLSNRDNRDDRDQAYGNRHNFRLVLVSTSRFGAPPLGWRPFAPPPTCPNRRARA